MSFAAGLVTMLPNLQARSHMAWCTGYNCRNVLRLGELVSEPV